MRERKRAHTRRARLGRIRRECRDAPAGTSWLIALMFAGYGSGLALIGLATQ